MNYQDINAATIDRWIEEGWEWGKPISHEQYVKATQGEWDILLTPTKNVPHEWFGELRGKKVLGLASGGGQQMPIFAALGADCTVLDYSPKQLDSERMVAEREGYQIRIIRGDMTKRLPFDDEEFDLIFHPVSNCYVKEVKGIWKECWRVLKKGGLLLSGVDHYINYIVDENEREIVNSLPFDPTENEEYRKQLERDDAGMQFSHSLEEQIDGQLEAGFTLLNLYEDTNGEGRLHELNIPTFLAMRSRKLFDKPNRDAKKTALELREEFIKNSSCTREEIVRNYYHTKDEDARLQNTRHGQLEYLTTMNYIHRYASKGSKVLEIGAGTGTYSIALAKEGMDVTSVELIESNLATLRKNSMGLDNIRSFQGDATDLKMLNDNTFDATLVLGPMYHLYDPEEVNKAIDEAVRVTKQDGVILFAFISVFAIMYADYYYGNWAFGREVNFTEDYKVKHDKEQLFTGYDVTEFEQLFAGKPVQWIATAGMDGVLQPIEKRPDFYMSDEDFDKFAKWHLAFAEKRELLGNSTHLLYICRKK